MPFEAGREQGNARRTKEAAQEREPFRKEREGEGGQHAVFCSEWCESKQKQEKRRQKERKKKRKRENAREERGKAEGEKSAKTQKFETLHDEYRVAKRFAAKEQTE